MTRSSRKSPVKGLRGRVVHHICEHLRTGDLKEGDLLCKETDLAQQLQVSRATVREAVAHLQGVGIVRSVRNKGVTVSRSDPVGVLKQSLLTYAVGHSSLATLAELRYVLEMGAIDLAVEGATAQECAMLSEFAEEFAELGHPWPQTLEKAAGLFEADRRFHGLILRASRNELVAGMCEAVDAFFDRGVHEVSEEDVPYYSEAAIWEHRAIAQALGARDVMRAHVLLSGHLRRSVDSMRALEASAGDEEGR